MKNSLFRNILPWLHFPALTGCFFLACGIVAGYALSSPRPPALIVYSNSLLYTIIFSCAAVVFTSSRLVRNAAFLLSGVLLAQHDYATRDSGYRAWRALYSDAREVRLSGRLTGIPCASGGKFSFYVTADSLFTAGNPGVFKGKNLLCYASQEPPAYGSVDLTGTFRPPRPPENPGGFNEYLYSLSNGAWGIFTVKSIDSSRIHKNIFTDLAENARLVAVKALESIPDDDYRGILLAAFLNDQSDISINMKKLFFQAGIYHLLALSGFNIVLLSGALFVLLFPLPLRREWKICLMLLFIWLYLLFIGFIPSLFRAVVMASIVGASFLIQRKNHALNSLGIAGIAWLFMSPLGIFSPSFQLSFAAAFALIVMSPFLQPKLSFIPSGLPRKVASAVTSAVAVSTACFIVTLPILIYHFNQLYLFGLFANLFAVSLMALAMWFGLAGFLAQVVFHPLVPVCMHGAQWCLQVMIQMAGLVRFVPWTAMTVSIPYGEVYVVFAVCLMGVIAADNKFRLKYAAVITSFFIAFVFGSFLFTAMNKKRGLLFSKPRRRILRPFFGPIIRPGLLAPAMKITFPIRRSVS